MQEIIWIILSKSLRVEPGRASPAAKIQNQSGGFTGVSGVWGVSQRRMRPAPRPTGSRPLNRSLYHGVQGVWSLERVSWSSDRDHLLR